jgi:hypothetical protein
MNKKLKVKLINRHIPSELLKKFMIQLPMNFIDSFDEVPPYPNLIIYKDYPSFDERLQNILNELIPSDDDFYIGDIRLLDLESLVYYNNILESYNDQFKESQISNFHVFGQMCGLLMIIDKNMNTKMISLHDNSLEIIKEWDSLEKPFEESVTFKLS